MSKQTNKQVKYKPVGKHIKTKWSKQININEVLPEYPRPQLQRTNWKNLNGMWKYCITDISEPNKRNEAEIPTEFPNDILVPFAIESSLSGVGKTIGQKQLLWYKTDVHVEWTGKKVLHFGAIDYESTIYINKKKVFEHIGGYAPFEVEVEESDFELIVKVWDPSDLYDQPRGKQVNRPSGIWYTSVTGIWQTVWIEPVNDHYIEYIEVIPDIDESFVNVSVDLKGIESEKMKIEISKNKEIIKEIESNENKNVKIELPKDMKLWTPDTPELYDIKITLESGDEIYSYFAMRKFSKGTFNNFPCFMLNNQPIFLYGFLDQGYWPDGLYTAPTDEALKSDIIFAKEIGINLLRKHVKTEPLRWYYYCDTLGIIVWQDMPSRSSDKIIWNEDAFNEEENEIPEESKRRFINEWFEIRKWVGMSPCINCWIPFNENWGQFCTRELCELSKDSQRLVNSASGGNHFKNLGDVCDCHAYPKPRMRVLDDRIRVCGEFGGIGKDIPQHTWIDANWGYIQSEDVDTVYEEYLHILSEVEGVAAGIYTQITDVEAEVNGLMTYDRMIVKVDMERMKKIHEWLFNKMLK